MSYYDFIKAKINLIKDKIRKNLLINIVIMSVLQNILIFLIYINSLSYALQCTTNCTFPLNLNGTLEIPAHCIEKTSADSCEFQISSTGYYPYEYFYERLSLSSSNGSYGDSAYVITSLSKDGSISLSYYASYQCKNKDDCARDLMKNKTLDFVKRLPFNYRAIQSDLLPLLTSNFSIGNDDVACFDSKENVRQCGIANKPGACVASQQLRGRKKTSHSCNNEQSEYFGNEQSVNIFDYGSFAMFDIKCNRSLCNGPMTLQAVKEIMFKYNITKTIDGRLNNGSRLSLSFTFLLSIIIFLLFI